jgi:hypothetical protein
MVGTEGGLPNPERALIEGLSLGVKALTIEVVG